MKHIPFAVALVCACLAADVRAAVPEPATAPAGDEARDGADELARLVSRVALGDLAWDEREAAEKALAALPAWRVLPALVPHMGEAPDGPFYPMAESPDADKDAPPQWQAFWSVERVWKAHAAGEEAGEVDGGNPVEPARAQATRPDLAPLLPDLLALAASARARRAVAREMRGHWSGRAEAPLARLFRDAAQPNDVRQAAAAALLAHRRGRYYNEVRGLADAADEPLKALLLDELMRARAGPGHIDPVLVMMAFELMELAERRRGTDSPGYRYARQLEEYLGERFRPDDGDPRYKGRGGPTGGYYEATVAGAREWWAAHGRRIQAEVAKVKPPPA